MYNSVQQIIATLLSLSFEGTHRWSAVQHSVPLMTSSVTELDGSADLLSDRYLSPRR